MITKTVIKDIAVLRELLYTCRVCGVPAQPLAATDNCGRLSGLRLPAHVSSTTPRRQNRNRCNDSFGCRVTVIMSWCSSGQGDTSIVQRERGSLRRKRMNLQNCLKKYKCKYLHHFLVVPCHFLNILKANISKWCVFSALLCLPTHFVLDNRPIMKIVYVCLYVWKCYLYILKYVSYNIVLPPLIVSSPS